MHVVAVGALVAVQTTVALVLVLVEPSTGDVIVTTGDIGSTVHVVVAIPLPPAFIAVTVNECAPSANAV